VLQMAQRLLGELASEKEAENNEAEHCPLSRTMKEQSDPRLSCCESSRKEIDSQQGSYQ
jgi:hypothetical protein